MAMQSADSLLLRLLNRIVSRRVTINNNIGRANIYYAFPVEFESLNRGSADGCQRNDVQLVR